MSSSDDPAYDPQYFRTLRAAALERRSGCVSRAAQLYAEADDAAEVLLVDDADGAGAETQYVNVRKDQRAKRAKGPKRFDPIERGAVLD